jgi:hypothetical protein
MSVIHKAIKMYIEYFIFFFNYIYIYIYFFFIICILVQKSMKEIFLNINTSSLCRNRPVFINCTYEV